MTYQKDPDTRPGITDARGNGRRNVLPLVLGALAIVVVGYMFLGDRFNTTPNSTNPTIERPVPKAN